MYSIHSNHPELIHLLENYHIKPINDDFNECFIEAIKCHHYEIANYLFKNFLNEENECKVIEEPNGRLQFNTIE